MVLSIVKPDGTNLVSSGVSGNGSFNNKTLPTTGTYTVLVNSLSYTGGVTLTLTQNITQPIALNTPQSVSSTLAGQVFDLTFSGTAGQVVSLAATNNNYRSEERRVGNVNPDGSNLVSGGVSGNGSFNNKVLPQNGTYTVLVYSLSNTGGVNLTLTPNITQSIAFNTPQSVSSTLAGQVFDLTFSGTAGQVVSLAATNNNY